MLLMLVKFSNIFSPKIGIINPNREPMNRRRAETEEAKIAEKAKKEISKK